MQFSRIHVIIKNAILSLLAKRTVGARALVVDRDKVLLVEHTYLPGWYTIGGGVEKGEPPKQALLRELREEVGVEARSVKLFNVYHNECEKRDDYVVFYICGDFVEKNTISASEIKEKKWFAFDALPHNISPSTLRRIQEYRGEIEISDTW